MPKNVLLAPPENVMVRCENLVKIYKTDEVEVMALQGLDLTVERGELMGIVGSSGSGKSTFLRCLNLLEEPTGGEVIFEGTTITDPACDINRLRQQMGMVFQQFNIIQVRNVWVLFLQMRTKRNLKSNLQSML